MKRKPRILIDTFHLYQALTGIRTYTTQLINGLEESEELEADYFYFPNWKKADQSNIFKGKLSLLKKIIHHASFLIYKQIVLPIYVKIKGIDILITTDFVLPMIRCSKMEVTVIHDVFFWELKELYPKAWRKYFTQMIENGIKKNSVIISTSQYTSEKIKKYITRDNDIHVIYQCPKLMNNGIGKTDVLTNFKIDPDRYLLHVGVLDKRKNLLTLIRAFSIFIKNPQYSNFKLVLAGARGIGKFQDDYDEIISLIQKEGLESNVVLTGFVENDALAELYRHANVYVFPSYDEGFGIPILEAFDAEIPVIISNQAALPEIAGAAALKFQPDSHKELAELLNHVQENDIRNDLIKKGKERLKLFSREAFVKQFEDVIAKYWA